MFRNAMRLVNKLFPVIEAEGYTKAEVLAALEMISTFYKKDDLPDDTDIREVGGRCGIVEFHPGDVGLPG